MRISEFKNHTEGTLFEMMLDAYSANEDLIRRYQHVWRQFDALIFDNLDVMNRNGFISLLSSEPVGFISWDPRPMPFSVEIGHNCIISRYKGLGYGKEQLVNALLQIKALAPHEIVVKTGDISFFLLARKMYESVGFIKRRVIARKDPVVPQVIEYVLEL